LCKSALIRKAKCLWTYPQSRSWRQWFKTLWLKVCLTYCPYL
jgi:hypothetical protein